MLSDSLTSLNQPTDKCICAFCLDFHPLAFIAVKTSVVCWMWQLASTKEVSLCCSFNDRVCSSLRTSFIQAKSARNPVLVRSFSQDCEFLPLCVTARGVLHRWSELLCKCHIAFTVLKLLPTQWMVKIWPIFRICMFKSAATFWSRRAFFDNWL